MLYLPINFLEIFGFQVYLVFTMVVTVKELLIVYMSRKIKHTIFDLTYKDKSFCILIKKFYDRLRKEVYFKKYLKSFLFLLNYEKIIRNIF